MNSSEPAKELFRGKTESSPALYRPSLKAKLTSAPPVYRPGNATQAKLTSAPPVYRPGNATQAKLAPAPPVYRPGNATQAKLTSAPPVYRPGNATQAKLTSAPPVYRPGNVPQGKLVSAPPVYRPGQLIPLQRKPSVTGAFHSTTPQRKAVDTSFGASPPVFLQPSTIQRVVTVNIQLSSKNHRIKQIELSGRVGGKQDAHTLGWAEYENQIKQNLKGKTIEEAMSSIYIMALEGCDGVCQKQMEQITDKASASNSASTDVVGQHIRNQKALGKMINSYLEGKARNSGAKRKRVTKADKDEGSKVKKAKNNLNTLSTNAATTWQQVWADFLHVYDWKNELACLKAGSITTAQAGATLGTALADLVVSRDGLEALLPDLKNNVPGELRTLGFPIDKAFEDEMGEELMGNNLAMLLMYGLN